MPDRKIVATSHAARSYKGFGCLNQKLKNQVDQTSSNAGIPTAPLDAKSTDLKVGVVNVPGVQQQYG
ncbi:MAG TPA: hypothetical protein VMU69_00865 [Bradyrhizobium sp.]|nr:hypothetical protein [Bradyrhizobium sp.]